MSLGTAHDAESNEHMQNKIFKNMKMDDQRSKLEEATPVTVSVVKDSASDFCLQLLLGFIFQERRHQHQNHHQLQLGTVPSVTHRGLSCYSLSLGNPTNIKIDGGHSTGHRRGSDHVQYIHHVR